MVSLQLLLGGALAVLQLVTLLQLVKAALRQGRVAGFAWGLLHYGAVFGAVVWLLKQTSLQALELLGLLMGYSLFLIIGLVWVVRWEQRLKTK